MDGNLISEPFSSLADAAFEEIAENFMNLKRLSPVVAAAARVMVRALDAGNKIMFCGNGGSAADSQHRAAEFMGRYLRARRPLPAIALTVDTSAITAISNDYSFADVFSRQLRGIGKAGDVLVGISTSGNSVNVVKAIEEARTMGVHTIGLTGRAGGRVAELCDYCICVPHDATNRIQEMHIGVGHTLCGFVEDAVC